MIPPIQFTKKEIEELLNAIQDRISIIEKNSQLGFGDTRIKDYIISILKNQKSAKQKLIEAYNQCTP